MVADAAGVDLPDRGIQVWGGKPGAGCVAEWWVGGTAENTLTKRIHGGQSSNTTGATAQWQWEGAHQWLAACVFVWGGSVGGMAGQSVGLRGVLDRSVNVVVSSLNERQGLLSLIAL